jgi:hypothetical protein
VLINFKQGKNDMTAETNSIANENIELYLPFRVEHRIGNPRFYEEYTNSFKTYEEAEKFFNEKAPLSMVITLNQVFIRIDNAGCFEIDTALLKEKDFLSVNLRDLHIC